MLNAWFWCDEKYFKMLFITIDVPFKAIGIMLYSFYAWNSFTIFLTTPIVTPVM